MITDLSLYLLCGDLFDVLWKRCAVALIFGSGDSADRLVIWQFRSHVTAIRGISLSIRSTAVRSINSNTSHLPAPNNHYLTSP